MPRNRNNNSDSDNNARIKVVYFEAENVNSDLTSVINAFVGAIRTAPVQIIPSQPPPPQLESGKATSAVSDGSSASDDGEEVVEAASSTPPRPRQAREKKSFQGKPDDSIDWNGNGTPFVAYFKEKNAVDTMKKYLVIATWFKRHGGKDSINTNIIYNAYRTLKAQVLADVGGPFQEGVKSRNGYFTTVKGSGEYAISAIGLQRVDDMTNAKAGDEKPNAGT